VRRRRRVAQRDAARTALVRLHAGLRPPSRRYSYGLHRAEDLIGIVIVAMILVSAIFAGTAEYALVILAAAAVAVVLIA
jgi:divalent metal cation (Fe/Co/Zn/Cd) transporter